MTSRLGTGKWLTFFYSVELWKWSQKIVGNFRRVWRYRTTQVVRVMPDLKAVVFAEGQLPFIVATPSRRKIGLWRAVLGHVFYIMSCVEKFIQHCLGLVRLFTIVFQYFLLDRLGRRNRRDHGSLSQNRPHMSGASLWLLEKKTLYTWCAGLIVHALLTVYNVKCFNVTYFSIFKQGIIMAQFI